jgi:hypothetical protein
MGSCFASIYRQLINAKQFFFFKKSISVLQGSFNRTIYFMKKNQPTVMPRHLQTIGLAYDWSSWRVLATKDAHVTYSNLIWALQNTQHCTK